MDNINDVIKELSRLAECEAVLKNLFIDLEVPWGGMVFTKVAELKLAAQDAKQLTRINNGLIAEIGRLEAANARLQNRLNNTFFRQY